MKTLTLFSTLLVLLLGRLPLARAGGLSPERLEVPNFSDAYFYKPTLAGQRPVIMYLHGRGGNPSDDCRKWAKAARDFGWVVCPQGSEDKGGGARAWANDPTTGKQIIEATLQALRAKYKRRVQLRGNVLVGFSEGAFVAMQVGLQDPKTWNRWLILGASDQYILNGKPEESRGQLRKVFLFTGKNDEVAPNTERVAEILKAAKIPVKVKLEPGLGHEVPDEKMRANYRQPLRWLLAEK